MKNVSIYTTPTCHFCHMTKEFFKKNNIQFTEFDVSKDMDKRKEMIDKTQQMGVPVTIIDDQTIIGFNEGELKKALGI